MTLSKLLFDLKSSDFQKIMIGKARTEIACTLSWFGNWNEKQRNEFGKVLLKNENQNQENDDASIEALMSTMTQMSLGTASKEGPSIFECQLKIFSKWHGSWSPRRKIRIRISIPFHSSRIRIFTQCTNAVKSTIKYKQVNPMCRLTLDLIRELR